MKRSHLAVAVVWLAFVIRGAYYSVQLPIWEGLDEWAHFAALDYFAEHGRMPARTERVSDAVMRSLELTPLPWSNNGWVAGAASHDEFWRLSPEERARRQRELASLTSRYVRDPALPPAMQTQYEGQQAPLYYALMFIPYRATRSWPIAQQVIFLRIVGILLASTAIPLIWSMARRIPAARRAALPAIAFVPAMPAVPLYLAHVGNDVLAFPLITLTLWTLVRTRPHWAPAGLALAAAMLTKGYALILLPLVMMAAMRNRRLLTTAALAILLSGWWYAGNLAATGTLTGDQLSKGGGKLSAVTQVSWGRVIDSGLMTHIWIGGWSFLQVRSWMYRVWEAVAVLAILGLTLLARRLGQRAALLLVSQLLFIAATLYFALNTYLTVGVSTGIGWYALTLFGAESILLACGCTGLFGVARARFAVAGVVLIAVAFDLYTVHFALAPYYSGLIRHRPNGSLEAYHWTAMPPLPRVWVLYLASNLALAAIAFRRS